MGLFSKNQNFANELRASAALIPEEEKKRRVQELTNQYLNASKASIRRYCDDACRVLFSEAKKVAKKGGNHANPNFGDIFDIHISSKYLKYYDKCPGLNKEVGTILAETILPQIEKEISERIKGRGFSDYEVRIKQSYNSSPSVIKDDLPPLKRCVCRIKLDSHIEVFW